MSKRRLIVGILVILVAALALPAAASAESGRGAGAVWASGDGTVYVRGSGWVRISGQGTLVIVDRAGDAEIRIRSGDGDEAPANTESLTAGARLVFKNFDGEAYVEGSRIIVTLQGKNIVLKAEGTGIVRLRGRGTYEFSGQQGVWLEGGITLDTVEAAD